MDRLEKQITFIKELDQLKQIGRQTYLKDGSRKENDAEHSWHLAIMVLLLQEYANTDIDTLRVMSMVLIHDIVEIDAGDTYAYDSAGNATKREREVAAAEHLFHMLPKDQADFLRELWDEFEEEKTQESLFAHAMDNFQPMMLNDASEAKAWIEHQVKLSQILKRNARTAEGSQTLWHYAKDHFLKPNLEKGAIFKDTNL